MKPSLCSILAMAAALALTPLAGATPVITQQWNNQTYGPHNNVSLNILDAFIETPGYTFAPSRGAVFTTPGWTATNINPGFSSAFGPTATVLDFTTKVVGDPLGSYTIDFYALNNGLLAAASVAVCDAGTCAISDGVGPKFFSENMVPSTPTPEPSSFVLFGTATLGTLFFVRKRRPNPL